MKKSFSVVAAFLFVVLLAAPSTAWQGRMAGVGDATGLIEDESDYLTHPAAIAAGKGFNAYGHYRLTYDKATTWDYSLRAPLYNVLDSFSTSGHSWKNEGQLGAAFALGAGRMGVFFDYVGVRGTYSGNENFIGGPAAYDLDNKLDNVALKVIYGLPAGPVNLGGEFQIAYRDEEQKNLWTAGNASLMNYPWAAEDSPETNLYPFAIPYKSKYWSAQAKASALGMIGPAKYAFTLTGGLPFASSNEYRHDDLPFTYVNAEGKVKGFNVGGDFWLRVPLSDRLVLPFVVAAGYKNMKRDGSGISSWPSIVTYEQETKDIFIKVGGGVDFTPAKGTKVAGGLYYDYLRTSQSIYFSDDILPPPVFFIDNYTDLPKSSEHRLTLKVLVEKELCSRTVLRGGVNAFYGRVKNDYAYAAYNQNGPYAPLDISTDGWTAGVNAAVGATIKLDPVSLEPFINAGYSEYKTSGDGTLGASAAALDFKRAGWLVGGGLSVKF
jgi:hypothetical protein